MANTSFMITQCVLLGLVARHYNDGKPMMATG